MRKLFLLMMSIIMVITIAPIRAYSYNDLCTFNIRYVSGSPSSENQLIKIISLSNIESKRININVNTLTEGFKLIITCQTSTLMIENKGSYYIDLSEYGSNSNSINVSIQLKPSNQNISGMAYGTIST